MVSCKESLVRTINCLGNSLLYITALSGFQSEIRYEIGGYSYPEAVLPALYGDKSTCD